MKVVHPDAGRIAELSQDQFLDDYWTCRPGEHVTLIGPTGCGKTHFGLRLLAGAREQAPDTRGLVLVMKPDKGPKSRGAKATGDATVSSLTRKLGGRITRQWPPKKWPWQEEPVFWSYWPRHTMDPADDMPAHHVAFRNALLAAYRGGDSMVFADEVYSLTEELKLGDELVTLWTKARGMGTSLFAATQRPAYVPLWMYSEASHFFLWKMTDEAAYKRIRDIGSVDSALVLAAMAKLGRHDCLYLYPREDIICVIRG